MMRYALLFIIVASFSTVLLHCSNSRNSNYAIAENEGLTVDLEVIAENISSPVDMEASRDENKRLFILQQSGKISHL